MRFSSQLDLGNVEAIFVSQISIFGDSGGQLELMKHRSGNNGQIIEKPQGEDSQTGCAPSSQCMVSFSNQNWDFQVCDQHLHFLPRLF